MRQYSTCRTSRKIQEREYLLDVEEAIRFFEIFQKILRPLVIATINNRSNCPSFGPSKNRWAGEHTVQAVVISNQVPMFSDKGGNSAISQIGVILKRKENLAFG